MHGNSYNKIVEFTTVARNPIYVYANGTVKSVSRTSKWEAYTITRHWNKLRQDYTFILVNDFEGVKVYEYSDG